MSFRICGLSPEPFVDLMDLDDAALAARGIERIVADEPNSAPCRVSLKDAEPGERLLLFSYEHQPANSPFHATGPIFVREAALRSSDCVCVDDVPPVIQRRTISVRAYDRDAMMIEGELVEGTELAPLLERWFERPEIDVVHLHYARRGCFAARAERV